MSKKYRDRVELSLKKRRDDVILCVNNIIKKATKRVLHVDEELRLMIDEIEKQTEKDADDFDEELKKQTDQIEAVKKRSETEDGLNKKASEEEVIELNESLLDHIDFVFARVERNLHNLDRAHKDARKQISLIVDETLELIAKIWRTTRDKMELIYSKSMDIIGARTGSFEDLIGLTDRKIRELQAPLPGLAVSIMEEEEILVDDLKIKLIDEIKRLEEIKMEESEKFEAYKKMKAEERERAENAVNEDAPPIC